ncbi:structural maintenance of chromosomes protein 6 [Lepeophtheirus salmonis]|uniref:structural maintenance of chromosomes protein 6 n=1 Tax=Lepeophtheirus salmonis TaxID=72036 RepID=UPI001AE2D56C|nr:structural maintenance of chromosomes protein 6-like [Lepeophtheirus salmonis]
MKRPAEEDSQQRVSKSLRGEKEDWERLPGMIEKVVLKQFMCHQEFVYSPTRRVNFVAGQNGSGKSAVLTGILFGLGGKAKDLGKSSLKDLIREGSNGCSVEVSLMNQGENGYRYEDFGQLITVVRSINRSGGNSYKFKDAKGHIVPVKKPSKELSRILTAFSIQITNPVTILMQETAKTLLKDATDTKLYTFFMLATQLEDCKKFYSSAIEKKMEAESRLEEKNDYKEKLEKEYRTWKKKYDFMQSIETRRKDIKGMKAELAWSIVKELENQDKEITLSIDNLNKKVQKYDNLYMEKNEVYEKLKSKKDKVGEDLKSVRATEEALQEEKYAAKQALQVADTHVKSSSRKMDELKRRLSKNDKEILELTTMIKKLKAEGVSEFEEKRLGREAIKSALRKEISTAKSIVDTTDNHLHNIEKTISRIEDQIREHRHEMSASKSKMETLSKRIKSLQGLKDNKFAVYGSDMVNLCAALEDNYRLFKHKPIGPLGAFIRFKSGVTKSQKILVDSELRKLCQAFIFDNYEDKTVFEKFARNYNYKGSKYTLTFRKDIYDVSNKKVNEGNYPSVFDLLEFDDANIANCLIDHRKIEKILILPTESLAQKMFSQSSPKNCSYGLVYSEERHCACSYYSHPYRSYMSAQLSQQLLIQSNVGEHLVGLEKELNAAQLEYNAIQEAHDSLKSGNIKLNYEERSLSKKKINEQQRIITEKSAKLNVINSEEQTEEPPMDVVVMEEDLEGFEEMKGRLSDELESESEQFASVKEVCLSAQKNYAEIEEKCSTYNTESLERKMLNIQSDINQIDKERNRITQKKTEFSEMISTKQEDKDKVSLEIDKHLQKAKKWSEERIDTIRSKDEIYNKIQAAEQSLKERQERVHESPETITKEYGRLGNLFRSVTTKCITLSEKIQRLGETLDIRKLGFVEIRKSVCRRIKMAFSMRLSARNYIGELSFDHKENSLRMSVNPEGSSVSKQRRGLKTLSGGEKSYSTISLILALWDSMHPPFRIMDEFDVFMDMVNRRVALDLIINIATDTRKFQYIFLTPLNIDNVQVNEDVSILKLVKSIS